MMLRLVLLALAVQAALPGSSSGTASIDGIVVRAGTNDPIDDAIVIVAMSGEPSHSRSVRSDRQGRFAFRDLESGTYRLAFERNGYPPQEYGQRVFPGSGIPVELTRGGQVRDLVARLTPSGSVSGRLLDEDGLPLAGVPMQLLRAEYARSGERTFVTWGSARSDDRGEYRLYFVTPGRYYLKAGAVQESAFQRSPNAVPAYYTPLLYPGVTDVSSAAMLDVRPGAELSGVDMTLGLQPVYRLRGRVIGAAGPPRATLEMKLTLRSRIGEHVPPDTRTIEDGVFEFRNLVPGAYVLSAAVRAPAPSAPRAPGTPAPARDVLASAIATVVIASADVDDLVLPLSAGVAISGRVRLDNGQPPVSAFASGGVIVDRSGELLKAPVAGLAAVGLSPSAHSPTVSSDSLNRDGTFSIASVLPGDYHLWMALLKPPYYVKEAWFGRVDVLGQPLHVTGTESAALDVLLGAGFGTLTGVVTSRQKPAPGVQVMLVPDGIRSMTRSFRHASSDRDGRFSFSDVVPGDYRVFATEATEARAWVDSDVLARDSNVKPIHITESSVQSVQLTPIAAR